MKTKTARHTPGPWNFEVPETLQVTFIVGGMAETFANAVLVHDGTNDIALVLGDDGPREVQDDSSLAYERARLIAATPDFYSACVNDDEPMLTRLAALQALLHEVRQLGLANDEDPAATSETLTEVEQLLDGLRVAVRKVREGL